jgi:hypothetical protein
MTIMMPRVLFGALAAGALLLGVAGAAWAAEMRVTVESVDAGSGTIQAGGRTLKLPQTINPESIIEGNDYDISYTDEGNERLITEMTPVQR